MNRPLSKLGLSPLQLATHLGALLPLALMLWDLVSGRYGAEPINEFTLRTGKTALVLLVLSLACTPINIVFGFKPVLRLRRPLGLYSFLYASIHFAIFVGVDYFFDLTLIWDALLRKRYALAGLSAGLILLALAITSTRGWQRRLKKNWKHLHRMVYAAGALVALHYIWLVKQGVLQPWVWGGVILLLLVIRLPMIKKRAVFPILRQHLTQK